MKKISAKMDVLRVADALTELWNIFKRCNKYIDETTPWVLAKDEAKKDRLAMVLYNLTEAITIGASLLSSFMPETSEKILSELAASHRSLEEMEQFGLYVSGTKVAEKPEILFARLDPKEVEKKLAAEAAAAEAPKQEAAAEAKAADAGAAGAAAESAEAEKIPSKPSVGFEDFEKCEFRVCEVLKCEFVPKSKKLLRFELKAGDAQIQILSGIKKWYPEPEKLVGKKVMAILNLEPRKIAGLESQGMLLSAMDKEGNLSLMTVMDDVVAAGAEVG